MSFESLVHAEVRATATAARCCFAAPSSFCARLLCFLASASCPYRLQLQYLESGIRRGRLWIQQAVPQTVGR